MSKSLILVSVLIFLGCMKSKQDFGRIYYLEQNELTTIIPLDCNTFENFVGLRSIQINKKEIYESLLLAIAKDTLETQYMPDVRYKIFIDDNEICLDYSGNFVTKNGLKGKINFIDEVKKYISENLERSVPITNPTSKPWAE